MKVMHLRGKEGGTEQVLHVSGVKWFVSDSRSCVFISGTWCSCCVLLFF